MALKKWYLTKLGGSHGIIWDFSTAKVMEEKELFDSIQDYYYKDEAEIIPYPDDTSHFDKRIGLYTYMLVAPPLDGSCEGRKIFARWIYSPSPEYPYLAKYDDGYED